MKLIATLSVLLFSFFSTNAQYNKGAKLLGGTFSFYQSRSDDRGNNENTKSTVFTLSPFAGKFYKANRLAGIKLNYGQTIRKTEPDALSVGAGVFLRQYHAIGKSAFYFFTQEELNGQVYRGYDRDPLGELYETKTTSVYAQFQPALAYGISTKLQAEMQLPTLASIGYARHKPRDDKNPNTRSSSEFSISTGFSSNFLYNMLIGFTYKL